MHPVLYKCGFLNIYTYGVFVATAFLVATTLLTKEARRQRFDENLIYNLCLTLLCSGIIFARVFYVALNWSYFRTDLLEIIMLQHGGLVWFGGLTGALLAGLYFIRSKKLSSLEILDLFAPYVALGQAIGRLGCFYNGCCYGRESTWGVYFPAQGHILFPSQLFDSFSLVLIFVFLRFLRPARRGIVFSFYLIAAGLQRFLLEFMRGDERPFYFSLSIFQWISLGFMALGLSLYLFLTWKKKTA